MIVYQGTLKQFSNDVLMGIIADRIIRNTYKTLLSRGQKDCFIYCEDSLLKEYVKHQLVNHI